MIGDTISVVYDDGRSFHGEIVTIRKMLDGRTLFTIKDDSDKGYRSLYLEKCAKYSLTSRNG